jgi:hypothetical protein
MMFHPRSWARWLPVIAFALIAAGHTDVLPEDRSDALWHYFSGGGITVQGPSVLIRKKIGDSVSASYQYYLDMISSASIDVVSQASPYKEHRTQQNFGVNFLHGNVMYSAGYISSIEPDFNSHTAYLNVSESMFGDLTTVNFGYTGGWDTVGRVDRGVVQPFRADANRHNYAVGLSQVLTRNLLLGLNFETDASDGFLRNPYRAVRYLDATVARGYSYEPEKYPATRTSNAASAELKYYLPWHAALDGQYRFYTDTWGILAHTLQLGYTQTAFSNWTFDASLRYYQQSHATFYSDLFSSANAQNFMARDRELAQFHDMTVGLGASYEFHPPWPHFLQKGSANFDVQRLLVDYQDFRDVLDSGYKPGTEPLYRLDATVMQFFISFWY